MTFDEARKSRRKSFWLGCFTLAIGLPLLIVSFLKIAQNICAQTSGPLFDLFQAIFSLIYEIPGILLLWPWMSDTSLDTPVDSVMSTTGIIGLTLTFVGGIYFGNWTRLNNWIAEVKELVSKKEMIETHRSVKASQQSTGNVVSGRDSNINQQITNHYNQRPDSPRAPIIVAVIGAVGLIATAFLHKT